MGSLRLAPEFLRQVEVGLAKGTALLTTVWGNWIYQAGQEVVLLGEVKALSLTCIVGFLFPGLWGTLGRGRGPSKDKSVARPRRCRCHLRA